MADAQGTPRVLSKYTCSHPLKKALQTCQNIIGQPLRDKPLGLDVPIGVRPTPADVVPSVRDSEERGFTNLLHKQKARDTCVGREIVSLKGLQWRNGVEWGADYELQSARKCPFPLLTHDL